MTPIFIIVLLLMLFSYFLGSFPSGVVVSKLFFGFDIRTKGSGNMGSTNVFRVLGKKWGIIVQLLDLLKGFLPVMFTPSLVLYLYSLLAPNNDEIISVLNDNNSLILIKLIVGTSAVMGHLLSFWVGFKGGKGINTAVGMLLAIAPIDILIIFTAFVITLLTTGFVSLGSLVGAFLLPISIIIRQNIFNVEIQGYYVLLIFSTFLCFLVFYTHRSNIKRLINKKESSFENLKLKNLLKKK